MEDLIIFYHCLSGNLAYTSNDLYDSPPTTKTTLNPVKFKDGVYLSRSNVSETTNVKPVQPIEDYADYSFKEACEYIVYRFNEIKKITYQMDTYLKENYSELQRISKEVQRINPWQPVFFFFVIGMLMEEATEWVELKYTL